MKDVFQIVSDVFQSVKKTVEMANYCDRAYAEGVNHPEYHPEDFGADQPEKVAQSAAGGYAADTAANLIAMIHGGLQGPLQVSQEEYIKALELLANDPLDALLEFLAKNAANLAWRAGQPFREIGTNPLNRITRPVNTQFNLLPADETAKDFIIRAGARYLLEQIRAAD